ncbi:heme-binding protein [Mycolicibacterium iranicum]|uniref:heme-binding protein n=1 Tax=Mycolicibacterium iranicum TaxID=912594 RepID=UPI000A15F394
MTVKLATALRMIAAAHAEAERRSILVSAAVVDAGGHLVAFGRMDGAEIAGPVLAVDKAYTAVANRIATSELAALAAPGGELFGIHANGGGRFVIFGGGVPVTVDGMVVGGIGVSGASAAEDEACALAAVRLFPGGTEPQTGTL